MRPDCRLKASRDAWKAKTVGKTIANCELRKQVARLTKARNRYKAEAAAATRALRESQREKAMSPMASKVDVIHIALTLFIDARIGFRAVSRVMRILASILGIRKAPCPQTVINWLVRLSIAKLQSAATSLPAKTIWCLDTSIALGTGKILAVLAVNADHFRQRGAKAITLADVTCLAVAVADSWTGDAIAVVLQKLIAAVGQPIAYLKDGGTDLGKAVSILAERSLVGTCIDDVSHVVANLFKHEYGQHPFFEIFISACGQASKKLKHTILACLVPPKVTTRARFMNLHRLVTWAQRVLEFSPTGRARQGSILSKLRTSLDRLPQCRAFIARFHRDAVPLLACQKVLKTKGLNEQTQRECLDVLDALPEGAQVRSGFVDWMETQLTVARQLDMGSTGLPVSSDPIESLFAVAKQHGVTELKDANQIARHVPALCGRISRNDAERVAKVTVAEQQKVIGTTVSLTKQRRRILHPAADFATLCREARASGGIEMIIGTRSWENNAAKSCAPRDAGNVLDLDKMREGRLETEQKSMTEAVSNGPPPWNSDARALDPRRGVASF